MEVDADRNLQNESMLLPYVPGFELPQLTVRGCSPVNSHYDYLANFARINSLQLVNTVGGGDCLFDAVHHCIATFSLIGTISELRLGTGLELNLNSELYRPLYDVEHLPSKIV